MESNDNGVSSIIITLILLFSFAVIFLPAIIAFIRKIKYKGIFTGIYLIIIFATTPTVPEEYLGGALFLLWIVGLIYSIRAKKYTVKIDFSTSPLSPYSTISKCDLSEINNDSEIQDSETSVDYKIIKLTNDEINYILNKSSKRQKTPLPPTEAQIDYIYSLLDQDDEYAETLIKSMHKWQASEMIDLLLKKEENE